MANKHNWANDHAGYLMGEPKDNHPERFPNNPEMDIISRLMFKRDELQATADRRLELLRRCNEYMAICPFCRRKSTDFHTDDCQLAKELSDATLGG